MEEEEWMDIKESNMQEYKNEAKEVNFRIEEHGDKIYGITIWEEDQNKARGEGKDSGHQCREEESIAPYWQAVIRLL